MTQLFASAHVVDLVLAVMVLEVALLLLYRHRTRHGLSAMDLLSVMMPGAFLLLALRGALAGAGASIIGACLVAALTTHLSDIARRWRLETRCPSRSAAEMNRTASRIPRVARNAAVPRLERRRCSSSDAPEPAQRSDNR